MNILVTFSDALNEFLKNNALWIALIFVGLIIITLITIFVLNKKRDRS